MDCYAIYSGAVDMPAGVYRVRRLTMADGLTLATPDCSDHATLDLARAAVPAGLVRVERDPADEPQIVEAWL